jgi:small subunit ribosomal protein S6
MRIYEELFIVRPDATDEQIDPVIEQLKSAITSKGGTLDKADKWGMRRLAYRVEKFNEAQYILLQFTAEPGTVKEVERRLRVTDVVMKFITVRIDEKLKRIDKRKKAREKRAARKPAPAAAAPATPLAPGAPALPAESPGTMPGAPGAPAPKAEAKAEAPVS